MRRLSIFTVGILAFAAVSAQGAQTQKIAPLYAKLDALSVKKDIAGMTKLLKEISTKDCIFINKQGKKQSPTEVLSDMAMQLSAIGKFEKSTSHIDKTTVKGDNMVAFVTSNYALLTKAGPDGKTHKIAGTSQSEDTWVKSGSSWKLKLSKTTKESTTMDGKPIPGGM